MYLVWLVMYLKMVFVMYVVFNNRLIFVNVNMCILSNEIFNFMFKYCEVILMFYICKELLVFISYILRV